MIKLTKLNGKTFSLNCIYIESAEAFPDTTLTLTNGKKIVVKETVEDVENKTVSFYRKINILGLRNAAGVQDEE
ncbi:flagellar FlbD family protein [Rossellomorea vietnamensis]|uniref:Flagellar FlbD family protein n=1 Tax=Rossellomorea vietnamensis TaxID=218284 RepID=A0A5D4KKV7_9BACI|nr:flagellar FlbD family protein [Rossellomorea vietnamensis]TYR77520.1 flagellar FlbD family protein [Rossellomorea vietnamensis]